MHRWASPPHPIQATPISSHLLRMANSSPREKCCQRCICLENSIRLVSSRGTVSQSISQLWQKLSGKSEQMVKDKTNWMLFHHSHLQQCHQHHHHRHCDIMMITVIIMMMMTTRWGSHLGQRLSRELRTLSRWLIPWYADDCDANHDDDVEDDDDKEDEGDYNNSKMMMMTICGWWW